ncbi:MAG: SRPBCC domain-containing protein [bacterium]|nr:SRPBCC domain-containing protein [Myxococcales bacterium]MCB9550760.1 SRPBCC domain-containing protein [Myxococcales bacterium]
MHFEAAATIDAPPETVWSILTDTAHWPEWDPYCERVEGQVALGKKVKVFTKLSPGRAFPVKVAELDAPRAMTWQGGMPFGLFKGVRTYRLAPAGSGTRFTMREEFSGPMLKMIGKTIPDMTEAFQAFVDGLKQRAEARDAA